ncbi:uncharacterized protein [Diadema antillarum]|uniref:uncharacterized protein n=1 Tax=Diadema antillarum TaxID=105358 RepID=UPI003A87B1AA
MTVTSGSRNGLTGPAIGVHHHDYDNVSAQWDCISVLNATEYYGNVSEYCTYSSCGHSCVNGPPWAGIESQDAKCRFYDGWILPQCYSSYGWRENCDIPLCNERSGCYFEDTNGTDYRGTAQYTENGYRCLHWKDVDLEELEDGSFLEYDLTENYCRNPLGLDRPWCVYEDWNGEVDWSYCLIPKCNSSVLDEFVRFPDLYIRQVLGRSLQVHYHFFDDFELDLEERCMRECVERTDFVCRQVFISFQWKQCVFAEVGEYYEGDLVNGYTLTHSDLFVRKSTHCDGFLPDFENNNKWAASKCVFPLGMEAGWIGDDDIVASSFLDEDHAPHNARLYGNSSWIPDPKEETPYIKVSFPERMVLVGLLLQDGRHHDSLYTLQFQLAFRLMGYDTPKLYSVQGRREPKITSNF